MSLCKYLSSLIAQPAELAAPVLLFTRSRSSTGRSRLLRQVQLCLSRRILFRSNRTKFRLASQIGILCDILARHLEASLGLPHLITSARISALDLLDIRRGRLCACAVAGCAANFVVCRAYAVLFAEPETTAG